MPATWLALDVFLLAASSVISERTALRRRMGLPNSEPANRR